MPGTKVNPAKLAKMLRDAALSYPETTEEFPWGETAIKVKGKAFLFMRTSEDEISFSVKLPTSGEMALDLPFTEPTHYGMGKYGWVTARFDRKSVAPPADVLRAWLDESFRAVAPKKLVAKLGERG